MNKKVFAIIGIVLVVFHMVFYLFVQYNWLYFLFGFVVLYLVFGVFIKKMK